MSQTKTILIMAGGTGGHVFPALSIAEGLKEKGASIHWLGTRNGLEAKVVPEMGFPIHYISVSGIRGKSLLRKILSPFVMLRALVQAFRKIWTIKPSCVLGMGGFVTGPGGFAAWLLRKPVLIHEQNAIAGLTNYLLSPIAKVVMEAFPGSFSRKNDLNKNVLLGLCRRKISPVYIGNPVRKEILKSAQLPCINKQAETQKIKLLVVGGSLGAVAINDLIPQALAKFDSDNRPVIRHQCGSGKLEKTLIAYTENHIAIDVNTEITEFIADMSEAYCWADVVICRAGAMTVAEIATIGIASILIPYPSAVDDHQTENARILESAGAATIFNQKSLSAQMLFEEIEKYVENKDLIGVRAACARKVAMPFATENAINICLEACND